MVGSRPSPSAERPPPILREFRGVWIASVGNINWPSRPDLTSGQQQQELIALFDEAVRSHLNAVVLQIRPAGDALYESRIEPWSQYLTGIMGKAPVPFYDPLEFAVRQAHARGLELHAWINPYRASILPRKTPLAKNHLAILHPEWVRTYGNHLWMDPGVSEVQSHVVSIVTDLITRYDLDGIHLDDYFYPYPEKTTSQTILAFPDANTFSKYQSSGGKLGRSDWRRQNVNLLVERLYREVKRLKPEIRFGISPFGIWRPGHPALIRGLDAYESIYADAKLWLNEGWVDYMSPQLYWGFENQGQDFGALHQWWLSQNKKHRHVWPGLNAVKVGQAWKADVIARQILYTRQAGSDSGVILWNIGSLQRKTTQLSDLLRDRTYLQPALPPDMSWVNTKPPPPPIAHLSKAEGTQWKIMWSSGTNQSPARWVFQHRGGNVWTTEILPAMNTSKMFPTKQQIPNAMALFAVSKAGHTSRATIVIP